MSERNFSVDDILAEVSASRGMTYEKRVNLGRKQADSLVDDILSETTQIKEGKPSFVAVTEPLFEEKEKEQPKAEQGIEPKEKVREKKVRKKNLEETMDPLAQITPWEKRHTEKAEPMTGAQESIDFLSSLKKDQTQVVEQPTQLLYKSAGGMHPPVETAPTQGVGTMEEMKKEELQQRVKSVAKEMESVYEPTRHVPETSSTPPAGFGDSPTVAVSLAKGVKADELTGQVRLSGFETAEHPSFGEEESSWEGDFLSSREEKVSGFHMETQPQEDGGEPKTFEDDGEYHSLPDASKVKFDLLARRRSATLRMLVTFVLFVFTLFLTVVDRFDISNGLLGDNPALTLGLYGGALIAGIVINLRVLWGGIFALFRGGDQDTPAALAMVLAVVQGVSLAFLGGGTVTTRSFSCLIGCAALFTLLMNLWGKRLLFTRMVRNFELVGNNRVKKAVTPVENREEAFELGRGLAIGSPDVVYSRSGVDLENFMYHSYAPDLGETSARVPMMLMPLFGALGGVFSFFFLGHSGVSQAVFHVISGICGCMQIALPITLLLCGNAPFHWFGKRLRSARIMMSGYDGVSAFKDTDVLALDASDLFPAGSISLKSIKSASNQSLDRSIMDVAGVVYMAESPLKPLFESIIQGKTNILPDVDTLVYEEEMGISGWVMGYRVLVGTKKLMETHGVAVPDVDDEEKYNEFGLKTVYLSTQGILSAIFLVKYSPNPKVTAGLQRAVKEGMSLHIYSCDPNITKELICKMFRLPAASVRIMSAVPRRIYKQQMEQEAPLEAVLSYEGNAGNLCRGVCAAKKLYRVIRLGAVLQTFFVVLGVVAFCTGLYLLGSTGVSGLLITVYHILATLVTLLLPRLKGR